MAATTEAMRDALTGALYARLRLTFPELEIGTVTAAVDLALDTTGYDAMADYVTQAETLIPLYQAEVPTPPAGIETALLDVENARTSVRGNQINNSLVVEP